MPTATMTYKNNIGGNLVESLSKDFFEKYNPADKSDLLGNFQNQIKKISTML